MTIQEILIKYKEEGSLTQNQLKLVLENNREAAVNVLRQTPNRSFALELLTLVIESRKKGDHEIGTGDNLMFASYLTGMHNQVEDALQIWKAKCIDFDSICYVDIQLVVFAGVNKTLDYLKGVETAEASKAIEYIKGCQEAGDFEDLDDYFSKEELPWWI